MPHTTTTTTTTTSGSRGNNSNAADDYVPPSQRGVVFLSSVPRDMRPQEVRMHFNQFGPIVRHKFTPFPKKERRPGGPLLPLQFMRGYVEFAHAEDAQKAAAAMNGTAVDCKRRRKCYGQLWTVKYMQGFTWDTLLEENEGALRTRRQREADARSSERAMNEAYRAAVLGKARRSKPRAESGQQQEEQKPRKQKREPEEPQKASGTKRMRGEVATATAVDQPAVKRKK